MHEVALIKTPPVHECFCDEHDVFLSYSSMFSLDTSLSGNFLCLSSGCPPLLMTVGESSNYYAI